MSPPIFHNTYTPTTEHAHSGSSQVSVKLRQAGPYMVHAAESDLDIVHPAGS